MSFHGSVKRLLPIGAGIIAIAIGTPAPGQPEFDFGVYHEAHFEVFCSSLATADIIEDGRPDLLVGNVQSGSQWQNPGGVRYLYGLGTALSIPVLIPDPLPKVSGIAALDMNLDGHVDVAFLHETNDAQMLRVVAGHGLSNFSTIGTVSFPDGGWGGVAAGDLNGDGCPDLVTGGGVTIHVLLGDCVGMPVLSSTLTDNAYSLELGDFDEDGALDLVASYDDVPRLYLGDGLGGFGEATELSPPSTDIGHRLAVQDFDGDGHLDVALVGYVTGGGGQALHLYFGDGDGDFDPPTEIAINAGGPARGGDFDEDGDLDIAIGGYQGFEIIENLGGTWGAPQAFSTPGLSGDHAITLADFDLDGHLDIAYASYFGRHLAVIRNRTLDLPFIRGDVGGDGLIQIDDPIAALEHLFGSVPMPIPCRDAVDVDDDGKLLVNDPVLLLTYLFSSGAPPAAPWPDCGEDVGEESLDCLTSPLGCP